MTFRLTPQMVTALRAGLSPIVPLIEVDLPGYTLRHLVGSGEVPWNGGVFVGADPRFGALLSAGDLKDGVGDEAPDWDMTFQVPDEAAVADLSRPEHQGAPVSGWLGVVDRATGQMLPDPIQLFAGTLDVPQLRVGKAGRTLQWRCISAVECFHDGEIGAKLSDAWHKAAWPGETGLANMTGIEKTSYWGVESPPSNVSYASSSARLAAAVRAL